VSFAIQNSSYLHTYLHIISLNPGHQRFGALECAGMIKKPHTNCLLLTIDGIRHDIKEALNPNLKRRSTCHIDEDIRIALAGCMVGAFVASTM
jgi:hypothetical protein